MEQAEYQRSYRAIVERIFNNWQNLRLAVEHGMGGRKGQQVAIDIMEYTYQYCIQNENITNGELQDVVEELMDQEFDTICEDGSVAEICSHLLRYKQMSRQGQYAEIEAELSKLPQNKYWLIKDAKVNVETLSRESSSELSDSSSDESMDIETEDEASGSRNAEINRSQVYKQNNFDELEPGWTTVRKRRK